MEILLNAITEALLLTLLVLSVLAILLGLWLILAPASFSDLGKFANRWVSTRNAGRWLEKPHYIERFFYRHHKIFGILLVAGAAFALYRLAFTYNQAKSLVALAIPGVGATTEAIAGGLLAFLLFGNLVVFFVGATVLGRPSLLKDVEKASNRWVSTRKASKVLEAEIDAPDQLAKRHPRVLGTLIVIGGLYAALQLGIAMV